VAPDIEAWFQADKFGGQPHIVAQWADAHNSLAQGWVTGDPTHAAYVDDWSKSHQAAVDQWIKDHPDTPKPQASDLAVAFFESFSNEHPGMFPSAVANTGADGKTTTTIQPVNSGSDVQADFFAMWRDDHPDVALHDVPGDLVTASGSGLDPNITLQNAEYQLDRVAAKWADDTHGDVAKVRGQIEEILQAIAFAPGYGLFGGDKIVNVLKVNLELRKRFGPPA
jgi:K+-transporting ATPase ATPase C chain